MIVFEGFIGKQDVQAFNRELGNVNVDKNIPFVEKKQGRSYLERQSSDVILPLHAVHVDAGILQNADTFLHYFLTA